MKQFLLIILLASFNVAFSQVTVTDLADPQQLIQNHLIGNPNFPAINFLQSTGTDYGSENGIGYFDSVNANLIFPQGIVLSTGKIVDIPGPNTSIISSGSAAWLGDEDLETLTSVTNTLNASCIQFDFVAQIPAISLEFMLASEEYGGFECAYSDVFAFIIKNNSAGTTENIALVPGTTTPIATTTVRGIVEECEAMNMDYFDYYNTPAGWPNVPAEQASINFNGQTKVFMLVGDLNIGDSYTIKIVVADYMDTAYDSALFVRNSSFGAYPVVNTEPSDLVVEDTDGNGIEVFDLTANEAQMLGNIDTTIYTFEFLYYTTLADAQTRVNPIANTSTFTNSSDLQNIYVSITNPYTGASIITMFRIAIDYSLLGTPEFESDAIAFYPNPVQNELIINCKSSNISQLSVYNMSGQLLVSQNNRSTITSVDFSNFPSGVYMVEVVSDAGRMVRRVVK